MVLRSPYDSLMTITLLLAAAGLAAVAGMLVPAVLFGIAAVVRLAMLD